MGHIRKYSLERYLRRVRDYCESSGVRVFDYWEDSNGTDVYEDVDVVKSIIRASKGIGHKTLSGILVDEKYRNIPQIFDVLKQDSDILVTAGGFFKYVGHDTGEAHVIVDERVEPVVEDFGDLMRRDDMGSNVMRVRV